MSSGTHGYICECNAVRCRERLYLKRPEYEALARLGVVMSAACAARESRVVLGSTNGAKAVHATRILP